MIEFNPFDHYWIIGGSTTEVYSSKRNIMVPVDDADYTAWLAVRAPPDPVLGDMGPLHIASPVLDIETLRPALTDVLPDWLLVTQPTFIQPAQGSYSQAQLKEYSADRRWREELTGILAQGYAVDTDRPSQGLTTTARAYVVDNPASTVNYKLQDNSFVTLDQTQMIAVATDISNHVQLCFNTEMTVNADIDAGTVTTLAQVDAAFDALASRAGRKPFEKLRRWQKAV